MREIKFRFWDGKQMILHGYEEANCYFHGLLVCEGDTIPLQYIGRKDKNGKEIFEGDIYKYDGGHIDKVEWLMGRDGACGFKLWSNASYVYKDIEVIGNIYENPELLK